LDEASEADRGSAFSYLVGVCDPAMVAEIPAGEVMDKEGPPSEEVYPIVPGEVQGDER